MSRQGFTTKRDAVAALNDALVDANTTPLEPVGDIRLNIYLAQWLDSRRHQLRTSTLNSYQMLIDRISPRLDDTSIGSLTPADVQRLQTDLLAIGGRGGGPLAAKTVTNTHVVLHKALEDAVRLGFGRSQRGRCCRSASGTAPSAVSVDRRSTPTVLECGEFA